MNEYLMYATFVCLGIIVVCILANLMVSAKKGKTSKGVNRVMYLSAILAVVLNAVRMTFRSGDYNGTLVFANIVVLVSLLISFRRMERGEENMTGSNPEDSKKKA